jgi:hypothetical protein
MLAAVLFLSPISMVIAGVLLVATVVIAAIRGVWFGRAASALIVLGGGCWIVSAGMPVWDHPAARTVAVMVDLSPSTRGAIYRDRAALDRRVAALVGSMPHTVYAFAGGPPQPLPDGTTLSDIDCDKTVFAPPEADAIILFSDGRFDPPAIAPPTFAVIDPSLEKPTDAAVQRLDWTGEHVTATVTATGPQTVHWTGADPPKADATDGGIVIARPTAAEVTAAVTRGDRWPENDRLTIHAPPPATAERWWVGHSPPPAGWRAVDLPTDPAAYLAPAAIVLDDVSADDLSSVQQQRLANYVRDLGGGVVIGGGPNAFAAGGYGSTVLDQLSPLASDPPRAVERWVLLVDGSGSMGTGSDPTPWQTECDAVGRVAPVIPPADTLRVGSFAAVVTWWAAPKPAGEVRPQPPVGLSPTGPTNLAAAVEQVADGAEPAVPTHLLLMTDADAELPEPTRLTAVLRSHHVSLHLLAIGNGSALPALRSMAAATGGSVVQQVDPGGWVSAARQLARQATPRRFVDRPTPVRWTGATGPAAVPAWNRTWLKPTADLLAKGPDVPLAARWPVGTGHAAAVAFGASTDLLASLAEGVASPPHDPRFTVTGDAAANLRVSVDAVDGDRYLNNLAITLQLDDGPTVAVEQTGPGLYAAAVPAPRRPALATVRADGRVIGRLAVPGRYPAEFDAVGTDRAALAALAARTGGAIVEPTTVSPLKLPGPDEQTDLTPPFATAGAAGVLAGLVWWRRRGA